MTRYRRRKLGPGDEAAAFLVSAAVGAGVAAAALYVTRLLLSREALEGSAPGSPETDGEREASGRLAAVTGSTRDGTVD